jgi:uncharacterized RDD family membrane protein YckC
MPFGPAAGRAPLSARAAACLFDLALAAMLGGVASSAAEPLLAAAGAAEGVMEVARKLLLLVVGAAYFSLPVAGPRQATFGQRWFGLRVLGADGGRPSLAEAFGRWLAFVAAALPLGAGLLLAFGPDGRPFQDRLSATRVVAQVAPVAQRRAA